MCDMIGFATQSDTEELQSLLLEYGMGLAGDIEEHVLLKRDSEIMAGALLTYVDSRSFHLTVLAVKNNGCHQGLGSQLLQKLLHQPQKYCYNSEDVTNDTFQVTTVARGAAIDFYKKNGFAGFNFSKLNAPYNMQCENCPEREECNPVPMVYCNPLPKE